MSTVFHPKTDRQTEWINQILEQYLQIFAIGKDWDKVLPIVKFEYNNSKHAGTQISLFYANYGFHSRTIWPTQKKETRNLAFNCLKM
jgi:hypothetical protein